MDFVKRKKLYFLISAALTIPGLIFLILFGLRPAIDFTGGSQITLSQEASSISDEDVQSIIENNNSEFFSIRETGNGIVIRTNPISQKTKDAIVIDLQEKNGKITEKSFETVGPSIGRETTTNAIKAVLIASILIALYIAFTFRHVSKPVASWKYGVCAIIALLHDVLVVVGFFAIAGYFFHVEVDALFITALLTVMGFSVHDTIVVFDRIREHLKRNSNIPFEKLVNESILETLNRSLNTSMTVIFVLFALLIFGGESIRWFTVALLIGMLSGTYSSIFTASQLLVVWNEFDNKKKKNK